MKKLLFGILGLFFISVVVARAEFNVNVNLGGPDLVVEEPPQFINPPSLGFYVAVGAPYDIFYVNAMFGGGSYYLYRDGGWYRSSYYNGPWIVTQYNRLPGVLRRHSYNEIIRIRDEQYRTYQSDRGHWRGKNYQPRRHEMQRGQEKKQDNRGQDQGQGQGQGRGQDRGGLAEGIKII